MIPFCTDTVTLYHYTGRDAWARHVLAGVRWKDGAAMQQTDGQMTHTLQTRIIIPEALTEGITIDAGGRDYLILGEGTPLTGDYTPADLKRDHPEMGTVQTVTDNTRTPFLKHWKVTLQ